MKNSIYTVIMLLVSNLVLAQTTTENYVKNTTPQVEVQDETALNNLSPDDKIETITYFDGLGRPIQRIAKQAGGQRQDIITPVVYDEFGRQLREYLPYARNSSSLNFETALLPDPITNEITVLDQFYADRFVDDRI
ncbi:DUF6443 domain-containing protein, partial [Winogradskyella sp.]|uniref:DUF6443 domain-containing protein n=1 Tax=Winogradskyella sp. TaxID=1883156 RepID=UPI0026326847